MPPPKPYGNRIIRFCAAACAGQQANGVRPKYTGIRGLGAHDEGKPNIGTTGMHRNRLVIELYNSACLTSDSVGVRQCGRIVDEVGEKRATTVEKIHR